MAGKGKKYRNLVAMARTYGVDQNELFLQAAEQQALLQSAMDKIRDELSKKDAMVVTKEYVKGRENATANPLLKELPRISAEANNTARTMLEIIKTLGKEPDIPDKLDAFLDSD